MEKIRQWILDDAKEDYVDLGFIVGFVQTGLNTENRAEFIYPGSEIQKVTLEVIRSLLEDKLLVAGIPTSDGRFTAWTGDVQNIMERIRREWDKLSRNPVPGDVVWLSRPELAIPG
jgi:hypothetical protein